MAAEATVWAGESAGSAEFLTAGVDAVDGSLSTVSAAGDAGATRLSDAAAAVDGSCTLTEACRFGATAGDGAARRGEASPDECLSDDVAELEVPSDAADLAVDPESDESAWATPAPVTIA
jgi:hypothetical protein